LKSKKKACCICYNPELDKLIYECKHKLDELSESVIRSLYYGYACDNKAEGKIKLINNYITVLEEENRKTTLGGKPCLDCNNLQKLAEKVRQLTHTCDIEYRKDLEVDKSGLDAWLLKYPQCVSYEKWERLAYKICGLLNLDIEVKKVDCDIDLDVFSTEQICNLAFDITRKIIPCDVMIAISIYKQACDLDLKITRTEKECKIDFDILHSKVNCDLDFEAYKKLVDCNLSFDIIKTVYENNCSFTIGDPIQLQSSTNQYPISGFNFKDVPDLNALKAMGISIEASKYLQNPKDFIKKLKSDYKK